MPVWTVLLIFFIQFRTCLMFCIIYSNHLWSSVKFKSRLHLLHASGLLSHPNTHPCLKWRKEKMLFSPTVDWRVLQPHHVLHPGQQTNSTTCRGVTGHGTSCPWCGGEQVRKEEQTHIQPQSPPGLSAAVAWPSLSEDSECFTEHPQG